MYQHLQDHSIQDRKTRPHVESLVRAQQRGSDRVSGSQDSVRRVRRAPFRRL
jgi:hypothetical protein